MGLTENTLDTAEAFDWSTSALHMERTKRLAPSLSVSYDQPLHLVRGSGAYLFDADGRTYLDCVNNVCHVGHSHPRIVQAAAAQMMTLNTNTRYLHPNILEYSRRLLATLPSSLEVCFFVNSGTEANDLALRLARTFTGRQDVMVIDHAYHGHSQALIDISPYKFNGPGGAGCPDSTLVVPMPDAYRGLYRTPEFTPQEQAQRYAAPVAAALLEAKPAAFIAESLLSCGGQIELPPGYLTTAYDTVRAAGGVCIADEVQVGFGRVGSHFWGFESHGVTPDIVTMGKPIGNGHPLAAVVTTRAIADVFNNGMEYFNTFGGNPVSCAVGLAVLDVLQQAQLQSHADKLGRQLLDELRLLQERHASIGDVRGRGLFLGIEFVSNRQDRTPDAATAHYVVQRMKDHGILLSTDGPDHNVIKFKPPMVFSATDASRLVITLDHLLTSEVS
ncbi:MAG: aminotransferase class III-fold pyridoxal phosphate-dependent enzyme [Pirellulaceae bacterium]